MFNFFSFCRTPDGVYLYFDVTERRRIISGKSKYTDTDSHTHIADFYGYVGGGRKEARLEKLEYNPIMKKWGYGHESKDRETREWIKSLDFKTIVPELIIKPIINPFEVQPPHQIAEEHLSLLKRWKLIWVSHMEPINWDPMRDYILKAVGRNVWDSVRGSVQALTRSSVGSSYGEPIWAYASSFFDIKYDYDFSSATKLWEMGLVPSFDGGKWRLHSKNGIAWEGEIT